MLVLAVDLDQLRRRLAERAQRRHATVDPGPGPPLGGHRAGEDHLALGVALPHDEARLDQRLGRAGPHQARIGPSAQDQLQRLDDQRLAGSRLPGEHGHAGTELERQVLDHAEVADVQVGQHRPAHRFPVGQQPEAQDAAEGLGLVAHDADRARRPPCR